MLSQPLNIEPAGPIASMAGLGFLLIVLFAPAQGLLAQWQIRRRQRRKLMAMLAQSAAEKSVLDRGQNLGVSKNLVVAKWPSLQP